MDSIIKKAKTLDLVIDYLHKSLEFCKKELREINLEDYHQGLIARKMELEEILKFIKSKE